MHAWRRHFFYTREVTRTTWKLRFLIVVVIILTVVSTRRLWEAQIAEGLQCAEDRARSDAIVIENFDPHYLLFERAAALKKAGVAPIVLVPVRSEPQPDMLSPVAKGFAEVMARVAWLDDWQIIPIDEREPITLNAAVQIRDDLLRRQVKSVTVVTSGLRSQRAALVNRAVLGDAGVEVRCAPVFGPTYTGRWTDTWHGIQNVTEEFLKLQYYRFYVLPFKYGSSS